MEFFTDIGGFILKPLYFLVSAIMLGWHQLWGAIFGPASGASWALSIIGLTVTIRALMIPLFVKQIKSSRNMQLLQPHVKELQKKYGHDRERLAQETMALYRETKTNPFASCLPLIIQMPFFLALFRMIDQAAKNGEGRGLLSDTQAQQLRDAKVFGVKISASRSCCAWVSVSRPRPSPFLAAWSIIRNSARKNGIWMSRGRHEASGLVLVSR